MEGAMLRSPLPCESRQTDIAARGLDFPGVDWVVQVRAVCGWST
jgi:hypothetical protein